MEKSTRAVESNKLGAKVNTEVLVGEGPVKIFLD